MSITPEVYSYGPPDLDQVLDYLGRDDDTDGTVSRALDAETEAQRRVCKPLVHVETGEEVWPGDLGEALCRRVARNLAMRNLPLGVQMDEMGSTRLGSIDPEVRRLEAPYRRLVIA